MIFAYLKANWWVQFVPELGWLRLVAWIGGLAAVSILPYLLLRCPVCRESIYRGRWIDFGDSVLN
jgi:hypothetical protein